MDVHLLYTTEGAFAAADGWASAMVGLYSKHWRDSS